MYTNNILTYRRCNMTKSRNKYEENLNNFIKWSRDTNQNAQLMYKYGLSSDSTNIHLPLPLKSKIREGLNGKCDNMAMYIPIKDYLKPITLAHCWAVSIINHNIKTGAWVLTELDTQYLNPNRLLKLIFHSKYDKEDHQYFSITRRNLEDALDKFITPFVEDYNNLVNNGYIVGGHELDITNIEKELNAAIKTSVKRVDEPLGDGEPFGDKKPERFMLASDLQIIDSIKSLTNVLIKLNLLHIYTGYAGSGKSTRAICDIPSFDCISVTRSNTVGMTLDAKYRRIHSDSRFIPKSITAYNLRNTANVNVIIDEFSQWELHDLSTLENILSQAKTYNKHVYILGDTRQMKGFISRGSLLEAYISLYEACGGNVIKCNALHRCEDLDYNGRVLQYISSGDANYLSEWIADGSFEDITENDFENIVSNGVILTDCGDSDKMFNKGRGCKYANYLVIHYLAKQHGIHFESVNDALMELTKIGLGINLLANETCIMDLNAYKRTKSERTRVDYKLLRNERAKLFYRNGMYIIELERYSENDEVISYKFNSVDDAMEHFTLGYAITVTRAQGLEWDHVIYVQDSYYGTNYETFYVAMTRCKRTSKCLITAPLKRMHHESVASHFFVKSLDK